MTCITMLYAHEKTNVQDESLLRLINVVNRHIHLTEDKYVVIETNYTIKKYLKTINKQYFSIYYRYNFTDEAQLITLAKNDFNGVYDYFIGLEHGLDEKSKV